MRAARKAVVFRADASVEMGSGHVMRCLTLADAVRAAGHDTVFVCRDLPGSLGARIAAEGHRLRMLPAPDAPFRRRADDATHAAWLGVPWEEDAAQTAEILAEERPAWLVVDHYALDARWQRRVRPQGTRCLVIDDIADRAHDADILLDQNLGRRAQDYRALVPDGCRCLIGPRYALLRPEFAATRAQSLDRRADGHIRELLIAMGGMDKDDATGLVLDALSAASLPEGLRIGVILGGQAPWRAQVAARIAAMPRPVELLTDVADMADRMAAADLAIGAAGATSWERCCLGVPALMVVIAANQAPAARALDRAGAARLLGALGDGDLATRLEAALADLSDPARMQAMSRAAAALVDGGGTARVARAMAEAVHDAAGCPA